MGWISELVPSGSYCFWGAGWAGPGTCWRARLPPTIDFLLYCLSSSFAAHLMFLLGLFVEKLKVGILGTGVAIFWECVFRYRDIKNQRLQGCVGRGQCAGSWQG